jgi:Transposase IS116/IS110/IS902 family
MAALLRGGMLPPASVSPATMRATRDLRRRRRPLAHTRAELLAHGHNTNSQSHRPALGTKLASKAHRDGVAERCADAAVHKSLAVALALITDDDALLRDVELTIVNTAQHHEAPTLDRRHTVPGSGTRLSLVRLSAIHAIDRFPRGQDGVSSCRLVTWARASAGTRDGTSGTPIGQAPLTWAFAEAAVLCLSAHPAAQQSLVRLEKRPGKGQALTIRAQKLARAVYDLRKRHVAFARATFCQ